MQGLTDYQKSLRTMAAAASRAEDEERHRIARGLHDDVGQLLAAMKIRLEGLGRHLQAAHETELKEAIHLLDQAVAATRSLTFELMAPPAVDLDIGAALEELAERIGQRSETSCGFTVDAAPKPLTAEVARSLYRVVRELLINVAHHSCAATATVDVTADNRCLTVVVTDDGVGFDASSPPLFEGVGLLIVAERMADVGGDVRIESRPDAGTRVTVSVPLNPARIEARP